MSKWVGAIRCNRPIKNKEINCLTLLSITFERDGEANFNFPGQSQTYKVFLLNASNNAPYSAIDEWIDKGAGMLRFGHHPTYNYEDDEGWRSGACESVNFDWIGGLT